MAGLNINLLFIVGLCASLNAGSVERIYIHDNKPSLKGSDIQLVCEISQFSNSDMLNIYQSVSQLPSSLAEFKPLSRCSAAICLTKVIGRYRFSVDNSHVFIDITNVRRSEDQKWWTCAIEYERKDMSLTVTTVPTSLQYVNPSSKGQDLAENAVQLKCSTGCSFPKPAISWYYSESGKDSLQVWSSSGTTSDTRLGCSDSERKYFSTLFLPRYTTFSGNIQRAVKFKCSIQSFTGLSQPLYTLYSMDVQFTDYLVHYRRVVWKMCQMVLNILMQLSKVLWKQKRKIFEMDHTSRHVHIEEKKHELAEESLKVLT